MTALTELQMEPKGCSYLTRRTLLDVNLPDLSAEQIPH